MPNCEISVDNTVARIGTILPAEVTQILYRECSFKIDGAEYSRLCKKKRWDGNRHLYKARYNSFPAGLLIRVCNALTKIGYTPDVKFNTRNIEQISGISMQNMESRWYQYTAVENAINAGRSIIKMATGGGKTVVAAMIIARLNTTTLFLVHTKDLLYQAKDEFRKFLGYECGQIGDGVIDIKSITIGTIQTISRVLGTHYKKDKYSEENENDDTEVDERIEELKAYIKTCRLFMQDEVHRVASDSAFEVANLIKNAPYRVGFSASPWRDDGADMVIEAAFGHRSFDITASELIDMGYLMQPTIIFRHVHEVILPGGTYEQIYASWVVDSIKHNNMVIEDAKWLLNSGRITMILVKQIKHGKILQRMLREQGIECVFLNGSDKSETRYNVINDLREGRLKCLIATTIADEGLDIKPLSGLVLAGRGKSSVRALQRIGRTLRPYDKPNPIIIDYYDRVRHLEEHTTKRIQIYVNEPKFILDFSDCNKI